MGMMLDVRAAAQAQKVRASPLNAEAFAPFGEVLAVPDQPGRAYFEAALSNKRPGAWPSLSLSMREPSSAPVHVTAMERHAFS